MLKTKLFKGFAALVVLLSLVWGGIGVYMIQTRVTGEAQNRVALDLSGAWAVCSNRMESVELVLRSVAMDNLVDDALANAGWTNTALRSRLERVRVREGLDFLDLIGPDGHVLMRTAAPYNAGDYKSADPAIAGALAGRSVNCMALLSGDELEIEAAGLAEKAFFTLEATPHARPVPRKEETRGMVMAAAVPICDGTRVMGVVYGGILVNRNHALIDRVHNVVYRNELYQGISKGTATIFLHDTRIATTVRLENGNRALGTRVSKEVADRVLDNGLPWVGEAFVVRDWYLTAYDPIRDCGGEVVGMLYVGILKKPFADTARELVLTYLVVSLCALVAALALAFFIAGRLAQPIHRLVEASDRMRRGERPPPVPTNRACNETAALIVAFNQMAATLAEREERLRALNRSYMETLGFVSHELKSPAATIMNYVYLLRERKLGELTEKQQKAVKAIDTGSQRLVEMVRHYLNLSRIENQELQPVKTRVRLVDEVISQLTDAFGPQLQESGMRLDNRIGQEIFLEADLNMVREVFENLISNGIKYGRRGGVVLIRAESHDNWVEFSVRNDGEGIPEDKIDALFQKFSRIETPQTGRRQRGTGLGLFITKHIVEAHGGRITAASRPGEWAEFRFTFPLYKEKETRV